MKNGFAHHSAPDRRLTSMLSTLAIWLCLATFPAALAAQAAQEPVDTMQEITAPNALEWAGIVASQGESGNSVVRLWDLDDAALELHLAEIELELNTTRDFDAGLDRLNPLWIRAARRPSNPDLMVKIAALRGKTLLELGRLQEAHKAVTILWPDEVELARWIQPMEVKRYELDKMKLDLTRVLPVIDLIEQRFASGREQWLSQLVPDRAKLDWAEKNFGLPGKALFHLVYGNIGTTSVSELGLRAVPSLVIATLSSLKDQDPDFGDPLRDLAAIDSAAAARTCLRWLKAGDEGFHFRTLELFRSRYPIDLQDSDEWHFPSDERMPTQLKVPEWMSVLEYLVKDPRMETAVFEILKPAIAYGGLSPALIERLATKMATASRSEARNLLGLLEASHRVPSLIPVYESGLASSQGFVRRECLRLLCEFPLGNAALSVVDDPDPVLRKTLATAINPRKVRIGPWVATTGSSFRSGDVLEIHITNKLTPALVAAWVNLVQDPDPAVRGEVLIRETAFSSPEEVYRAGLASPDPQVRSHFARELRSGQLLNPTEREKLIKVVLNDADPAVRATAARYAKSVEEQRRVFAALLADPDRNVQAALDSILYDMEASDSQEAHFEFLLDGRLGHASPLVLDSPDWREWCDVELRNRPDLVARALPILVRHKQGTALGVFQSWFPHYRGHEIVNRLSPQDQADLYAYGFRLGFKISLDPGSSSSREAFRLIALDQTHAPDLRLVACGAGNVNLLENEAAEEAALHLIRTASTGHLDRLSEHNFRGSSKNAFMHRVVEEAALDDAKALRIAEVCFDSSLPGAEKAARALLDRFIDSPYSRSIVASCLMYLTRPTAWEANADHLMRAIEDPALAEVAVQAMNRIGDDSFLAPLGACLLNRANSTNARQQAAAALKRYGPPAREYLIQALLTTEGHAHNEVLGALQAIDEWEARQSGAPRLGSREEAIAELLRLMKEGKSAAVRAEAIRGIATFGAIEAIPLLIPLLEEDDKTVQEAAKEALEQLHDSARKGSASNGN